VREAQKENHDNRIGKDSDCFRASGASWIPAFAGIMPRETYPRIVSRY
jgi:hypothetical protein